MVEGPVEPHVSVGPRVTWEQFEQLPEDPRAEYIDGQLIVTPSPTEQHQYIAFELGVAIRSVAPPTHRVVLGWSWKPGADEFIPDLMVCDKATIAAGGQARFTGTPALAVEVLSSNRGDDLIRKMAKYAEAGLPHYWIVDPRAQTLTTYAIVEGLYAPTAVHGRGAVADLDLGVATVRVDVAELLG
ncbi:Uma2 family endonuclease [Kineococcus sp. TBRC 1896]|uniref:Uma2 family endonuclease n=1 Tax=Kineococcus mangrovi TaxID=1660183 RepID=A0ABV4I4U5_9ACTN